MKVYEVWMCPHCTPFIDTNPDTVRVVLEEAEVDETITVQVLEMSEEEVNALPEWMGP
jgi:hypothetical protein